MSASRLVVGGLVLLLAASGAFAQRGIGQPSGVARTTVKPDIVTVAGKIIAIETGPCERTTGRASVGSHVVLETEQGERLNVHLGPTAAVEFALRQLQLGQQAEVHAFRTAGLTDGHYVAQSIKVAGAEIELRDSNLQPVWAGRGRGMQTAAATGRPGRGPGWARGGGRGWR